MYDSWSFIRDPQHSSSLLHNNMSVHGITDVSIRNSNKTPPPENGTDLSTSLSEVLFFKVLLYKIEL